MMIFSRRRLVGSGSGIVVMILGYVRGMCMHGWDKVENLIFNDSNKQIQRNKKHTFVIFLFHLFISIIINLPYQ